MDLNPYLSHFYHHHRRYKVLYGGRGSGKSYGIADIMLLKQKQGRKVACFREFQNKIEDSVYTLLCEEIERCKLTGFRVYGSKITHTSGGMSKFHGMARDPDGIQSMQGFDDAWVEEAHVISQKSLTKLTPTFRKKGCEIWLGGNPQRKLDVFSQRFIENKLNFTMYDKIEYNDAMMRIKLNYSDNPWYHDSDLEIERREAYKIFSRAMYDHIWNGGYMDTVPNSIILAEWVDAALDAHKKMGWEPFGSVKVSHDPADSSDARATLVRHGNVILEYFEDTDNDINSACSKACEVARRNMADSFIYDSDGPGLGLRRQIHDFFVGNVSISEFKGGAIAEDPEETAIEVNGRPVTNRQFYYNLRSQQYHKLAERFRKTYQAVEKGKYIDPKELISIDSEGGDFDKLKSELTSIARKYSGASGSYQLMSKPDMLKHLKVKSPNLSDCAMMSELDLMQFESYGDGYIVAPNLGMV